MIPRLRPYYRIEELKALINFDGPSVSRFEKAFARAFDAKYALTFNYGRSALYAILKSNGIRNAEVILPAYTCVVVADAIVLSGNIPRFVDISFEDYNMDLELAERAINSKTGAILVTHLFGYPLDTNRLKDIVGRANKDLLVIQDCAQSFGVKYNGSLVCNQGDVAFFSLRMNKIISTILGAIATTNNREIYEKLKRYRDECCYSPGLFSRLRRLFYVLSTYPVFNHRFYRLVNDLENLGLLDYFTKSYSEKVAKFPSDSMEMITPSGARLGMVQLEKYEAIIKERRRIAAFYNERLANISGLTLPPVMEEATWSYYAPRVKNKNTVREKMKKRGVQVGEVLEYAVPYMALYQTYRDRDFLNALECSRTTINLPCHPGLGEDDLHFITNHLEKVLREMR